MAGNLAENSNRPMLKQLNKLKKSIAFKWYDLGIELLEPENIRKLDEIQSNNPRDASTCCTKMFQLWLDKQPEASWEQLIKALRDIDLNEVGNAVEEEWLTLWSSIDKGS